MLRFQRQNVSFKVGTIAALAVGLLLGPLVFSTDAAPTQQHPIEDFVSQQGTYCLDDGAGGCILFDPPLENFGWWDDPDAELAMRFDYAGIADRWLQENGGTSLGTEFSGTITERPLKDGRAEVKVNLHVKNALTWVIDGLGIGSIGSGPVVFGNKPTEVLAGAEPALGNGVIQGTFINTAPGDPLPDVFQLDLDPLPGQEDFSVLKARLSAEGLTHESERLGLEEGVFSKAKTSQTGLFNRPANPNSAVGMDGYPVEFIKIQPVGGGAHSIPEPSGIVLLGLGLLGLLHRNRWSS